MDRDVLKGVRVLDWTTMAAAPGAGAILADFGAEVIKVETPKGDPWRKVMKYQPGRSFGSVFEFDNRGKKSVCLDLTNSAGIQVFKILLEKTDVLVTNVRASGIRRLGLDYESLKNEFPKLVYAHLTAWGRTGPMVDAPGYDMGAFWAATGMLDTMKNQETNRFPALAGASGDHATSLALVAGISLALFHRERTGSGRLVDVSLLRSGLWCNGMYLAAGSASKETLEAVKNPHRYGLTFRAYETKDNEMIQLLGYQTGRHLPMFLKAIGLESVPSIPPVILKGNGEGRPPLIDKIMKTKNASEWEAIFDNHGVWYTRVLDLEHLLEEPETPKRNKAYGEMSRVNEQIEVTGGFLSGSKDAGLSKLVAAPISFGGNTVSITPPKVPELGEHTLTSLAEIGLTKEKILAFKKEGAFGKEAAKL